MNYKEAELKANDLYYKLKEVQNLYWELAVPILTGKEGKGNNPPLSWLMGDLKTTIELAMSQTFNIQMTAIHRAVEEGKENGNAN